MRSTVLRLAELAAGCGAASLHGTEATVASTGAEVRPLAFRDATEMLRRGDVVGACLSSCLSRSLFVGVCVFRARAPNTSLTCPHPLGADMISAIQHDLANHHLTRPCSCGVGNSQACEGFRGARRKGSCLSWRKTSNCSLRVSECSRSDR
eukprot:835868-Rhodomonas_salina.1